MGRQLQWLPLVPTGPRAHWPIWAPTASPESAFLPLSSYSPVPSPASLCFNLPTSAFPDEALCLSRKLHLWVPPPTLTLSSANHRNPTLSWHSAPARFYAGMLITLSRQKHSTSIIHWRGSRCLPHTAACLTRTLSPWAGKTFTNSLAVQTQIPRGQLTDLLCHL